MRGTVDLLEVVNCINKRMIFGEKLPDIVKERFVSTFLEGMDTPEEVARYKMSMRVDPRTDCMYPNFFLPPLQDGKKGRLLQGYLPKTHILYANYYELEILRILYLFRPDNPTIQDMVRQTLIRLKGSCFGRSCTTGECFATGICVLRFLTAVCPEGEEWIHSILGPLKESFLSLGTGRARMQGGIPISYFLLALDEIEDCSIREIVKAKAAWLETIFGIQKNEGYLQGDICDGDNTRQVERQIVKRILVVS